MLVLYPLHQKRTELKDPADRLYRLLTCIPVDSLYRILQSLERMHLNRLAEKKKELINQSIYSI